MPTYRLVASDAERIAKHLWLAGSGDISRRDVLEELVRMHDKNGRRDVQFYRREQSREVSYSLEEIRTALLHGIEVRPAPRGKNE